MTSTDTSTDIWVDCGPTIGRLSTDSRPIAHQYSTDSPPIYRSTCRTMHRPICSDQLPVKYRSSIGKVWIKYLFTFKVYCLQLTARAICKTDVIESNVTTVANASHCFKLHLEKIVIKYKQSYVLSSFSDLSGLARNKRICYQSSS